MSVAAKYPRRKQMLNTARKYSTGKYISRFVAKTFQQMIRAEAAAIPAGLTPAIVEGELQDVFRKVGECACITCGKVMPWNGGVADAGHFLGSRSNSIIFQEDGLAPQCSRCNRFRSGEPQKFRQWMEAVRGQDVIERLERVKNTRRHFTREELVDLLIGFKIRLKAAKDRMESLI